MMKYAFLAIMAITCCQILTAQPTAPNQPATLSSMLEPGKRAVTVRVDDVRGVAGFIQPGDFVYSKSYSEGHPVGAILRLRGSSPGVVSPLYICFHADPAIVNDVFKS